MIAILIYDLEKDRTMKNLNNNIKLKQTNQDPLVIFERCIVIEKSELLNIKNLLTIKKIINY